MEATICGCSRADSQKEDITGMRSGMVEALEPTEEKRRGVILWKCRCDCGKEFMTEAYKVSGGHIKSYGCLQKEHEAPTKYMRFIDGTCIEMLERKELRSDNTSGYTGVTAYRGKWRAQITFKGKNYVLGTYTKIEDAAAVRKEAEGRIFGEFLEWYYENYPDKASAVMTDKKTT